MGEILHQFHNDIAIAFIAPANGLHQFQVRIKQTAIHTIINLIRIAPFFQLLLMAQKLSGRNRTVCTQPQKIADCVAVPFRCAALCFQRTEPGFRFAQKRGHFLAGKQGGILPCHILLQRALPRHAVNARFQQVILCQFLFFQLRHHLPDT